MRFQQNNRKFNNSLFFQETNIEDRKKGGIYGKRKCFRSEIQLKKGEMAEKE